MDIAQKIVLTPQLKDGNFAYPMAELPVTNMQHFETGICCSGIL